MTLWFNGELAQEALVPAQNAGSLLGWGVFSTVGVCAGRLLLAERHVERLRRDATAANIPLAYSTEQILNGMVAVSVSNALDSGLLRLTLTKCGDGRWSKREGSDLLILAHAAPSPPCLDLRINVCAQRFAANRPLSQAKLTSYYAYQWAWQRAREGGFDDSLLLSEAGHVCESTRSNIFWRRGAAWYTAALSTGCLRGVGREFVLDKCAAAGIPVLEATVELSEIQAADEVVLLSAATGPRSVGELSAEGAAVSYAAGDLFATLAGWWAELNGFAWITST